MAETIRLNFTPAGPTVARLLSATEIYQMIMGPVGSGKTVGCCQKIILRARQMPVSPIDGQAHYKCVILRNTLANAKKSTIPTWTRFLPKDFGRWQEDPYPTHYLSIGYRGKAVNIMVQFIGLGDDDPGTVFRGLETTDAYINEADQLPEAALKELYSRCGRYPEKRHGELPFEPAVWMDCNAPPIGHWVHERFVVKQLPGHLFLRQPGGLSPNAENLKNLKKGYYENLVIGNDPRWVKSRVHNEFVYVAEGRPVYEEFREDLHVSPTPLLPDPYLPLIIGADFGLTPAFALVQQAVTGQWRILNEIVLQGQGIARAAESLMAMLARLEYKPIQELRGWGDPAGVTRAQTDEKTCFDVLRTSTGLPWSPAPTNSLAPRIEAVRGPLSRLIDGRPGLLLSPTCHMLIRAFAGGYRFDKIGNSRGEISHQPSPRKDEHSHIMEGLQYALLGGGGYSALLGRQREQAQNLRAHSRAGDYDPLAA